MENKQLLNELKAHFDGRIKFYLQPTENINEFELYSIQPEHPATRPNLDKIFTCTSNVTIHEIIKQMTKKYKVYEKPVKGSM